MTKQPGNARGRKPDKVTGKLFVVPWNVLHDKVQPDVDKKGSPETLDFDRARRGGDGEGCWNFVDEVTFDRPVVPAGKKCEATRELLGLAETIGELGPTFYNDDRVVEIFKKYIKVLPSIQNKRGRTAMDNDLRRLHGRLIVSPSPNEAVRGLSPFAYASAYRK